MAFISKNAQKTLASQRKKSSLSIQIEDVAWRRIPKLEERLNAAVKVALSFLPKALQFPIEVTLLLADDKTLLALNRDFRGLQKATNVLSFPQFEPAALTKKGKAPTPLFVGDIVISYQYIVVEAQKYNKILINHVIHLLIHGLLHLFGYDHMKATEALRMERLEKRIMAKLGLPDPYKVAKKGAIKSPSAKRNQIKKYRHTQ